ncbi:MAG: polyprenyl synthetase family protein [Alphaproteobacteria bacterium]
MEFNNLKEAMLACSYLLNKRMEELLSDDNNQSKIVDAMRYSALSSGKKIRPFLLMSVANIFGYPPSHCLDIACAVEFVHVYSLIHDDLPAMDDDDYRRGKPSNHKKFDEPTAILAGDSLLTLAFEIISSTSEIKDNNIKIEMIRVLSKAIGYKGMVGGQMIDIENSNKIISKELIANIHRLKTGELFMASCEMGAIIANASEIERKAVRFFAHDLGLAFQMKDDILDHQGMDIGKTEIDEINHKKPKQNTSVVDIIGLDNCHKQLILLKGQAKAHLKIFGNKADLLNDLTEFLIQ